MVQVRPVSDVQDHGQGERRCTSSSTRCQRSPVQLRSEAFAAYLVLILKLNAGPI